MKNDCRHIIDGTFKRLYDGNSKLFPEWFRESIKESVR